MQVSHQSLVRGRGTWYRAYEYLYVQERPLAMGGAFLPAYSPQMIAERVPFPIHVSRLVVWKIGSYDPDQDRLQTSASMPSLYTMRMGIGVAGFLDPRSNSTNIDLVWEQPPHYAHVGLFFPNSYDLTAGKSTLYSVLIKDVAREAEAFYYGPVRFRRGAVVAYKAARIMNLDIESSGLLPEDHPAFANLDITGAYLDITGSYTSLGMFPHTTDLRFPTPPPWEQAAFRVERAIAIYRRRLMSAAMDSGSDPDDYRPLRDQILRHLESEASGKAANPLISVWEASRLDIAAHAALILEGMDLINHAATIADALMLRAAHDADCAPAAQNILREIRAMRQAIADHRVPGE